MSERVKLRIMFSVAEYGRTARSLRQRYARVAYDFKRRMVEGWTPEHSHTRNSSHLDAGFWLIVENRKRTMDVSLPTLRMDSTQL